MFVSTIVPRPAPVTPETIFEPDALTRLAGALEYRRAEPFPHLVLDGLFDPDRLRAIVAEFPARGDPALESHDDGVFSRGKHNTTWETRFGPHTRQFLAEMASPPVLLAMEAASGIGGLIPDPYLFGAGMHFTGHGGKLSIHADFSRHPRMRLERRLNILVYLNEGWTDENQGWLELWDHEMRECVKRVLPVFNRTVMFSTSRTSFHGQPEPILGPPDIVRRSLAFYYYSNGRPEAEDHGPEHSTLWRARPGEILAGADPAPTPAPAVQARSVLGRLIGGLLTRV